jgi:hypothetical protein
MQDPYSNLTCISSWYICIPNIIWIHLTINEKMNRNCHYQECYGRTNWEPDGHLHTIISPVFNGRIKTLCNCFTCVFADRLDLCIRYYRLCTGGTAAGAVRECNRYGWIYGHIESPGHLPKFSNSNFQRGNV